VGNVGGSSSDQTLNALDLDNLVLFEPDVDDAEECRSKYDMKFWLCQRKALLTFDPSQESKNSR